MEELTGAWFHLESYESIKIQFLSINLEDKIDIWEGNIDITDDSEPANHGRSRGARDAARFSQGATLIYLFKEDI